MSVPLQVSASSTATSGLEGDTEITSPTSYQYNAPFSVGRGATATSSAAQSGGLSTTTIALIVGGALVAVVAFAALSRPAKPSKK